ncbi:MAG: hypothetical protein ACRDWE_05735 [Acidimicrobiales bacterium]
MQAIGGNRATGRNARPGTERGERAALGDPSAGGPGGSSMWSKRGFQAAAGAARDVHFTARGQSLERDGAHHVAA